MSYDDEIQRVTEIERVANGRPSRFQMDAAFCARMHAAIAAGLECAPTSISTTPGTKNPKYVSELTAKYHRPVNERWGRKKATRIGWPKSKEGKHRTLERGS
jgi:hypothetical protein